MSQIRSNEISHNLSIKLSFPSSIEEQEKLKEEDEGFLSFLSVFVDSSYIRYEFLTLGISITRRSFQDKFSRTSNTRFLRYKTDFLPNPIFMIFNKK